jgi:hypothetical protein
MSDDLVKLLRRLDSCAVRPQKSKCYCGQAADRIEKLEARILLLEGWLNGSLNVVEAFVAADTKEARKALEGKNESN